MLRYRRLGSTIAAIALSSAKRPPRCMFRTSCRWTEQDSGTHRTSPFFARHRVASYRPWPASGAFAGTGVHVRRLPPGKVTAWHPIGEPVAEHPVRESLPGQPPEKPRSQPPLSGESGRAKRDKNIRHRLRTSSILGESPPTIRRARLANLPDGDESVRFRGHAGFLQVRGSVGMASGPDITGRRGDHHDSRRFSGAALGAERRRLRSAAISSGRQRHHLSGSALPED